MIDLPHQVADLAIEVVRVLVGRPVQRARARRLLKKGRGQCVLSYPRPATVLRDLRMSGVADLAPGSITLHGHRIDVLSIERPGWEGFDAEWPETRMVLGPPQVIHTVHAQGGTLQLTLLRQTATPLLELVEGTVSSADSR